MIKKILVIIILISYIYQISFSKETQTNIGVQKENIGIGINYPGISIKYFISNNLCFEPKIQFGVDILVFGIRPSYYFNNNSRILIYSGLEVDYVSFKGDVSEGYGIIGEPFIGLEFFSTRNLSIQFFINLYKYANSYSFLTA